MPRTRRRGKQRRRDWTQDQKEYLLWGFHFGGPLDGFEDEDGVVDLALVKQAWDELRAELMVEHLCEIAGNDTQGPGTRPHGWWLFDAPERRRRIDGKPHPFDDPKRQAAVGRVMEKSPKSDFRERSCELHEGVPCCRIDNDDATAKYETQADYLDRLGLWLPGEKKIYERESAACAAAGGKRPLSQALEDEYTRRVETWPPVPEELCGIDESERVHNDRD